MGQADINATDKVSYVTVTYELVPSKYNILMWYLKFIPTCFISRLSITDNTITIISVIFIIKQIFLFLLYSMDKHQHIM